jgi:hypothetical protein
VSRRTIARSAALAFHGRGVDADPLALDQAALGQPLQAPR